MNKKFIALLAISLAISSSAFFAFPIIRDTPATQVTLAISMMVIITQTLGAWFFLRSLGAFKKRLRIAYTILAIGALLLAISQFYIANSILAVSYPQFVSAVLLDPVFSSILIIIPTVLGAITMYIGTLMFARLLEVRSLWSSIIFVVGLAVVLAVIGIVLPHVDYGTPEITLDVIFGPFLASSGFSIAAAILTWQLKKKLSNTYQPAMRWLSAGLWLFAFVTIQETLLKTVVILYVPGWFSAFLNDIYTGYSINGWLSVAAATALLGAGLLFRQASKKVGKLADNASYLDVVTYIAELVSQPAEIDVHLDKVRQITAAHEPGTDLSTKDKATLIGVYLQLENYLTTEESLRKLTKEDLRIRLPEDFRTALTSSSTSSQNIKATASA